MNTPGAADSAQPEGLTRHDRLNWVVFECVTKQKQTARDNLPVSQAGEGSPDTSPGTHRPASYSCHRSSVVGLSSSPLHTGVTIQPPPQPSLLPVGLLLRTPFPKTSCFLFRDAISVSVIIAIRRRFLKTDLFEAFLVVILFLFMTQ